MRLSNTANKTNMTIWALLDCGSDSDFFDLEVQMKLAIDTTEHVVSTTTMIGKVKEIKRLGNIILSSPDRSYECEIQDAVFTSFPTATNDVAPVFRDLSAYSHMKGINFPSLPDKKIHAVIGVAHHSAWLGGEIVRGKMGDPVAFETQFGWTISGQTGKRGEDEIASFKVAVDDLGLKEDLEKIFYYDYSIISDEQVGDSVEAREALEQLEKSSRFEKEKGKYVAGLIWKGGREAAAEKLNSVDSESMALRRLESLKRSMKRDPDKREKAFIQVRKFIEHGRAEVVNEKDFRVKPKDRVQWRIPGHLVHQNSKWRFCHDGRAAVDGICLNEELISDLNLLTPLLDPIMNLREWIHALTTDIEAFFHNILVDDLDKDAFLFYWWEDEEMTKRILIRFLAHIFGATSSPTITSYILKLHAERIKSMFGQEVYDVIRNFFYVDDGTAGSHSEEGVKRLKIDLEKAMNMGGFKLAKWKSNSPELLGLPQNTEEERYTKVLGIGWDTKEDRIFVAVEESFAEKEANTPRDVVTMTAQIFDPLGLVAPAVLTGRRWTQLCMKGKWGWDLVLEPKVKRGFNKWARAARLLSKISIPRCWNDPMTIGQDAQLHIFTDASQGGYGAVAYRRTNPKDQPEKAKVSFVLGKSHVVPLDSSKAAHHNLAPRLELVAAVKGVELKSAIEKAVKRDFVRVFLWADSEIVLKQINNRTARFGPFHKNRLSKIHAASNVSQWYHVDGGLNPADICSRGILDEEEDWKLYLNGPPFLSLPESEWPHQKDWQKAEIDISSSLTIAQDQTDVEEPVICRIIAVTKLGDWNAKIRRIACLVKFVRLWKAMAGKRSTRSKKKVDKNMVITMPEWEEAERKIIEAIQGKHFSEEIKILKDEKIDKPNGNKELRKRSSKLTSLNPFLDSDGLIRCGSRLTVAPISYGRKFPVIVPRDDKDIASMIRNTHRVNYHSGIQATLCAVKRKYWLLQGANYVRKIINACPKCQRALKRPEIQKMGPLPEQRVRLDGIFENTGLDLMGPFLVKRNGRADHKAWVVIFTCLASRAVHAEVVFTIEATTLINAIHRFTSRRPGVKTLLSDQGSNMTAAAAILKKEWRKLNEECQPELQKQGVTWSLIPVANPHRGGVWERMVALFKNHLYASLNSGGVTSIDTFITAIIGIESIINQRPLTTVSSDSRDPHPLTVDMLLNPGASLKNDTVVIADSVRTEADKFKFRWKESLAIINHFRSSFYANYLTVLANRTKWRKSVPNIPLDSLVILVDESKRRRNWKLARVIKAEGTGPHNRRYTVKKADGEEALRDRSSIIRLELDE